MNSTPSNKASLLAYACLTALFLPFVGPFKSIDVQPIFFFLLTVWLVTSTKRISLTYWIVFLSGASLICTAWIIHSETITTKTIATHGLGIISPFLIITFIKNSSHIIDSKAVLFFSLIYIGIALIQLTVDPEFLVFLTGRSVENVALLTESGRGVRSLTGEPSHFGRVLLCLNAIYALRSELYSGNRKAKNILKVSFLFLLASAVLAQSAYAVLLHLIFVLSILYSTAGFRLIAFSIFSLPFIAISIEIARGFDTTSSRLMLILFSILENPEMIVAQGAFDRVLNIPLSIYGWILSGPFGAGDSERIYEGVTSIFGANYFFSIGNRNLGGLLEYNLKYGALAIPIALLASITILRLMFFSFGAGPPIKRVFFPVSIACFFLIFQNGSVLDPLAWMVFSLAWLRFKSFTSAINRSKYA